MLLSLCGWVLDHFGTRFRIQFKIVDLCGCRYFSFLTWLTMVLINAWAGEAIFKFNSSCLLLVFYSFTFTLRKETLFCLSLYYSQFSQLLPIMYIHTTLISDFLLIWKPFQVLETTWHTFTLSLMVDVRLI